MLAHRTLGGIRIFADDGVDYRSVLGRCDFDPTHGPLRTPSHLLYLPVQQPDRLAQAPVTLRDALSRVHDARHDDERLAG